MTKLFSIIFRLVKKYTFAMYPTLRLQTLELFKDQDSDKPYVIISPLSKYRPHNVFLEELIENKNLLRKLDFDSLCYIFYAYGILKASEKNNLYSLVELLPSQTSIKVKNIKTLTIEEWDKNKFNIDYVMLDKNSLKLASCFFSSFNNQDISHNQEPTQHRYLKLVK